MELHVNNKIEKLANKQVELVATFYRIYGPNSYLKKHVDMREL